ncbi:cytochrome P450 [Fusarium redolens]|uniref:Cytochrome P450 n=1 Tax=Fusarium redolens TaxID=48865 RepID=A0A9P9H082_FUSRE|nr:cytochrome P450 [Fusarium redolens]KAH7248763.1 cytochrome P450 [Fusarium redolens]
MIEHYPSQALFGLTLAIATILLLAWAHWRSRPTLPLPPGPPSEFLLGHSRVIPRENAAAVYAKWSKEYNSDIIHVRSLGRSTVVLNIVEVARDILEKKGANFCDRPRFTLLEVMGWGKTLTFLPFGKRWQMHRKLLQTSFSNTNVRQWHSLQTKEARRTIRNILKKPETWETSLRRLAVAIVLQVSYGTQVLKDDDPYIQIANDAMYATGNGGVPANSIVDLVPFVRYLPDCIVRDLSLRFARQWRWAIKKIHNVPFAAAQAEYVTHQLLREYKEKEFHGQEQQWSLDDIKGAAGAVFIAGADTVKRGFRTWATCVIFILNMVLHPEIQEKAHKELDTVIGSDRLPGFSDRPALVYIEHIVHGIYRWSPLAPLGIPHKSLHDDIYKGMLIPKGISEAKISWGGCLISTRTVVYANAYTMAHDGRVYKNPHDFNPNRYEARELFPVGNFGFGRRVCVGRFLADNSVWIMVATMLSALQFCKMSSDGKPIEPRVRFTNGGTCHPEHFDCVIKPRNLKAEALVESD